MTGPEHYAAAQECMAEAVEFDGPEEAAYLARAQVHATLALAAATALGDATETDRTNWRLAMRGE